MPSKESNTDIGKTETQRLWKELGSSGVVLGTSSWAMERTQCPQNSPNVNPQNGRDTKEEAACMGSFQVSISGQFRGVRKWEDSKVSVNIGTGQQGAA